MRKIKLTYIITILFIIVAVLATAFTAIAKRNGAYVGSEECAICHMDTHPAFFQGHERTLHSNAMIDVTERPEAVIAKFDENAPFDKEQIKYALGIGRVYQNYLDENLKLLPGKWVTAEQKWVEIESVDGATQCVGCHVTNLDSEDKTWTELGVQCETCHGPGGDHAESMEPEDIINLGELSAEKSNMVCGQCHSVGTDPTGKFAFSVSFVPGDDLHKHFELKPADMGQTNAQYNEFIKSEHGKTGMKCISCHDTHGNRSKGAHQLVKPINDLCLACHGLTIESMKAHAPNAGPKDTCATCHMIDASHEFKKSKPIE